jgi:hypothetical protein
MSSTLFSGSVWGQIRRLSQRANDFVIAASPYFGSGATGLLRLRRGNILIVKFDREAIGSGQVDPHEIVKALKKGVEIHSCSNFHAKIYIFGNTAVVGSANVSKHSDRHLLEACVATTDRNVVKSAKRFVRSLLGDEIGLDFAVKMIQFYRPPKRPMNRGARASSNKRPPSHSDLWLVSLVENDWEEVDYVQEKKGWAAASKAIENPRAFEVKDFQWSGGTISRFKVGQRIIQCTKTQHGRVLVSPPSRIVGVRRYRVNQQRRAIVFLESPKKYRRRQLDSILRALGQNAKALGNPRRTKQLRDPELIYALGHLWG